MCLKLHTAHVSARAATTIHGSMGELYWSRRSHFPQLDSYDSCGASVFLQISSACVCQSDHIRELQRFDKCIYPWRAMRAFGMSRIARELPPYLLLEITSDGDTPITSRSVEVVQRVKLNLRMASVSTPTASMYSWLCGENWPPRYPVSTFHQCTRPDDMENRLADII